MKKAPIVVAITGASGAAYAQGLLQCLTRSGAEVHLLISPNGQRLLKDELDISRNLPVAMVGARAARLITIHPYHDIGDVLASGSFLTAGMVVCPCSTKTLGEISAGLGGNLIARAAAVHLKEARRLILVVREMPLSAIDLENMLRISRAGGIICPASPGFYLRPQKIDDLINFVAGKVCDLLGVKHSLRTRWQPGSRPPTD